jgi:hypothetical protein
MWSAPVAGEVRECVGWGGWLQSAAVRSAASSKAITQDPDGTSGAANFSDSLSA